MITSYDDLLASDPATLAEDYDVCLDYAEAIADRCRLAYVAHHDPGECPCGLCDVVRDAFAEGRKPRVTLTLGGLCADCGADPRGDLVCGMCGCTKTTVIYHALLEGTGPASIVGEHWVRGGASLYGTPSLRDDIRAEGYRIHV